MLKLVQKELEKQEGVLAVSFNGWLFEGYDDAKSALISSILIQLGEHKRFGPKVRGRVASLLKRVNYMRMASLILKQAPPDNLKTFLGARRTLRGFHPTQHVLQAIQRFLSRPAADLDLRRGNGYHDHRVRDCARCFRQLVQFFRAVGFNIAAGHGLGS